MSTDNHARRAAVRLAIENGYRAAYEAGLAGQTQALPRMNLDYVMSLIDAECLAVLTRIWKHHHKTGLYKNRDVIDAMEPELTRYKVWHDDAEIERLRPVGNDGEGEL